MNESRKASIRRFTEAHTGGFPWMDIFKGRILDAGAGGDPLPFENVTPFDTADGDANKLSEYFPAESFDVVHGSQIMEHLFDPRSVIADWLTLVKPGGHIVITVPDMVGYEGLNWPSKTNGDHKSTWSMIYKGSKAPLHIHIPTLLDEFRDRADVLLARYVEQNFDWMIGHTIDQTYDFMGMVEVFNEFVLRKKP